MKGIAWMTSSGNTGETRPGSATTLWLAETQGKSRLWVRGLEKMEAMWSLWRISGCWFQSGEHPHPTELGDIQFAQSGGVVQKFCSPASGHRHLKQLAAVMAAQWPLRLVSQLRLGHTHVPVHRALGMPPLQLLPSSLHSLCCAQPDPLHLHRLAALPTLPGVRVVEAWLF